jgi:type II secretory pathway pseudopilin PulG
MGQPSRAFKVGSVVWSVLIALAVLVLGAAIMLPSTKRARLDFRQREQMRAAYEAELAAEAAAAATQASGEPATQPGAAPDRAVE